MISVVTLGRRGWSNSLTRTSERGAYFDHARAVRLFLALPAGGAPSEATFSSTTEMVTKKRNRMGDATLEMLTVVRDFLRHPDFDLPTLIKDIEDAALEAVKAVEQAEEAVIADSE